MNISIIYEDDSFLVIEKPAGVVVNSSETVKAKTVQEWASSKLNLRKPFGSDDFYNRSGIVHRLDKDTSGLLLIAKDAFCFAKLQAQFAERLTKKKYLALVHGRIALGQGQISARVGRLPWNRKKFGVLPQGRESRTLYDCKNIYYYQDEIYSFLEVAPVTGRTHQIRIHLKYLGHPIFADKLYCGRKVYQKDLCLGKRMFLHAGFLEFEHPRTETKISFESSLPADLKKILDQAEKYDS